MSDILGHSSIQITSDIYGHTMDDQKRNATERMGRLFEPDEAPGEDTDEEDNEAEVGG
ncbi:MAG: hypothetical protein M3R61_04435 [Chloroflexota bacterium]|nr:hypothetical protein [Chloroflexota bacterium]